MADNPIVLSERSMSDLKNGRMTQTRVVLKNVPPAPAPKDPDWPCRTAPYLDAYCHEPETKQNPRGMGHWWVWRESDGWACPPRFKVGVAPGDRLWVREAWKPHSVFAHKRPHDIPPTSIYYRADKYGDYAPSSTPWVRAGWMPRWASRFTLDVVDVRVERLQDISEKDAIASGIHQSTWGKLCDLYAPSEKVQRKRKSKTPVYLAPGQDAWSMKSYRFTADEAFERLWNREHGKDKWHDNPWVAAFTFRLIRANIDQVQP
jgi:hypothetical protein